MKYDKILIAASMAMLVWSCSDENIPVDPVTPTPGGDVQFGAGLEVSRSSRTVYGDLSVSDDGTSYPILWSNGDSVKIMSPQCYIKQGKYKVNLGSAATAVDAGKLQKVGVAGVQWGDVQEANFYSVYPGLDQNLTIGDDARTVQAYLDPDQTCYYTKNTASGGLTYVALPDMGANIMTAAKYNAPNGSSVNLLYKPVSTALRITLTGPSGSNNSEAIVSRVRIIAPQPISGKFTITFPEDSTEANKGVPTITMPTQANSANQSYDIVNVYSAAGVGGGFLTLGKDEKVELNAFIMLDKETLISSAWSLEVVLSDGTVFTKKLGGTGNMTLIPGQIHSLPAFPALDIPNNNKYDVSKWMTYIPRNIYLSEISIPGSWNSLNKDFQSNLSIDEQYKIGVRAFHLDTRWRSSRNPIVGSTLVSAEINGLALADGSTSYNYDGKRLMHKDAPLFETKLNEVLSKVAKDEYMIVFCSFAQDSYVNPNKTWMAEISEICDKSDVVYDGKLITPNTVVNDVLGKVIIIVNCENAVSSLTLPADSKCLFVNVPMTLTEANFNFTADPKYNIDYMYYSSKESAGVYFANTQAQVSSSTSNAIDHNERGYAPTLGMRQTVGNAILSDVLGYYKNINNGYPHNAWIYLGLGGYQVSSSTSNAVSGSYATVASTMNGWINGKVTAMTSHPGENQTTYYPVGLVLMNFVNNADYGIPVVRNILELNNKYQKAFDSNQDAWPDDKGNSGNNNNTSGGGDTSSQSKSAGSFSVDTDNWEVF